MGLKILYLWLGLFCSGIFFTPAALADTVLDQFSSIDYGNNDGTVKWASNWKEINESDGANAGDFRVTGGELRVQGKSFTGGDKGVSREVDLLGATSATLSFQYRRNRLDNANDYVTISVSANGGVSWTELERFAGPNNDGNNQPASYDISGYVAANTMIRFLSSPNLGYLNWPSNDRVYFDDVQIEFTQPTNPLVSAISRVSTNPSTAGTAVDWLVTFDQAVTGVDATDFTLIEAGGAGGATILSVTGSGTSWTVTADTGTSDTGTLGLNLVDDDSIRNAVSLPLGGAGVGNGNFVGEVYTLVPPVPVLGKTASAYGAVLGDMVSFTLSATNPYAFDLTGVVLTDTLPAGMNYETHLASLGSADISGQDVVWTIPTLPAGGSAKLFLAVSFTQTGSLTNTVTAPGATAASATVLVSASSAVTHFRMDEMVDSWDGTAGEVIDTGGTGLHGRRLTSNPPTTTNIIDPLPTIDSQYPSVVGQFCNSGSFDGGAVVEVADSPLFDYTTQFSASAWVYPTAYPPSELYSILSNDVNYEFHINSAGKLYWWWNNGETLTSNASILLNQWTHIAITFDSSAGARIYINGVQDNATNNLQGTLEDNDCNFYIGGDVATGSCSIMPARNFRGRIDEVKLYAFELSAEEVVADMTRGRSCSPTFDHIRIEHTGVGLTCQRSDIILRSCADAACTSESIDPVTVTMTPATADPLTWIGGDSYIFTGHRTVQLRRTEPGVTTLGLTNSNPVPINGFKCYDSGVEGDCDIEFFGSGFIFDVPDLTSCQTSADVSVQAVQANTASPPACIADAGFSTVNKNVNFWSTYVDPATGDEKVSINKTELTGSNPDTTISLDFDANATAVINVRYPDAGEMQLNARYDGVGTEEEGLILQGSDSFVARPVGLCVYSEDAKAGCASGDGTCSAFKKVDQTFNLKVKGVCWEKSDDTDFCTGNATTPNFQLEKLPISHNLVAPSTEDVSAGSIGVSQINMTSTDKGEHIINNQTVSEVGVFTFTADPPDYFGASLPDATSANIGRFTPDHFITSVTNNGVFQNGCSGFTYSGQDFGYVSTEHPEMLITATNSSDGTTVNYRDGFVKLTDAATQITMPTVSSDATNLGADEATPLNLTWTPDVSLIANDNGTLNFSLGADTFTYTRENNALVQRFTSDIRLSVTKIIDSDGIAAEDLPQIFAPTGTQIRFGRMQLQNAYGPETLPLTIPVFTEYFDGTGFILNDSDNCTDYAIGNVKLDIQLPLEEDDTFVSEYDGPLVSGLGNFILAAPDKDGSADVTLDLSESEANMEWLQPGGINPNARATFGIFRGNERLIYMRESIW